MLGDEVEGHEGLAAHCTALDKVSPLTSGRDLGVSADEMKHMRRHCSFILGLGELPVAFDVRDGDLRLRGTMMGAREVTKLEVSELRDLLGA